ncbi:MAG: hypothetical protein EKK48_12415 [Candidatus Melainabacteria bacterium]|nr:MAG: hypothetical protein EKK48_12415 [Candidatus Melainabacteria bacterium]
MPSTLNAVYVDRSRHLELAFNQSNEKMGGSDMEAIPIVAAKVLFRILLAAKMTAINIEEHKMPDAIARQAR